MTETLISPFLLPSYLLTQKAIVKVTAYMQTIRQGVANLGQSSRSSVTSSHTFSHSHILASSAYRNMDKNGDLICWKRIPAATRHLKVSILQNIGDERQRTPHLIKWMITLI